MNNIEIPEAVQSFLESCSDDVLGEIFDALEISLDDEYFSEPGVDYDDVDAIRDFSWERFQGDPCRYLNNDDITWIAENYLKEVKEGTNEELITIEKSYLNGLIDRVTYPPIAIQYVEANQPISLDPGAVNTQEIFSIEKYKEIRDELNSIPKWVRKVCKWFKRGER